MNEGSDPPDSKKPKKSGHGRHGADKFVGAKIQKIMHPTLQSGDICPAVLCNGKVYRIKDPQQIIRLYGSSLAKAVNYQLEKLRCNLCLKVYTAPLPTEAGSEKYSTSFRACLAVNHYYMGLPFYRIARYQAYVGVPLPASNQFSCMEKVVACVLPVYQVLLTLSAGASGLNIDDTTMHVQSLTQENKQLGDDERKGVFTTAMIAHVEEHTIHLVMTGRQHAGENLSELLKKRKEHTDKLLLMCDALSRNIPTNKQLKSMLMVCYCLAHARRNFFECRDEYSEFCDTILNYFSDIYKNELFCKSHQLSDVARLAYHRKHSRPAMKNLYRLCLDELSQKKIEPNSSLGKAINYMIKHRRQLTRFLRIPGAQIDNNADERLIKQFICYRKNSLSYRNEYGAFIGDVLMSLIITAITAKINPVHYLTQLQDNASAVLKNPELCLPWNYQQMIESPALINTS